MRILVTGASSLPGFRTVLEALNRGYNVLGLSWEHPIQVGHEKLIKEKIDIRNYEALKSVFEKFKPDVVVHMAALGNVDLCEKDKNLAWAINTLGSINIAKLSSKYSKFMVYLSTDYVFDGEQGNYKEMEAPNPVNYYGLSKLTGEGPSLSADIPCAVVRSSSIYGFGPGRENFAKFLFTNLSKNNPVKALVDQYTSPTESTLLGRAIMEIVERELSGIFHVVGERMSRFDFALKVADTLCLDKSLILGSKMSEMNWYAKRPKDSSLNCEETRKILKTNFFSTENALRTLKEELEP